MKDKKAVKKFLSSTSILVLLNVYICLSVIFVVIHLIAPIAGGVFHLRALLFYGSWIGLGLFAKYNINKYKNKTPLKWYEALFQSVFGIACMFLWFTYPINFLASILIVIANIVGKIAQERSWGKPHAE